MIPAYIRRHARSAAYLAVVSIAFSSSRAFVSSHQSTAPQQEHHRNISWRQHQQQHQQHRQSQPYIKNVHTEPREHRKEGGQMGHLEEDNLGNSPRPAAMKTKELGARRERFTTPIEHKQQEQHQRREQQGQQQQTLSQRSLNSNTDKIKQETAADAATAKLASDETSEEPTPTPETTPVTVKSTPSPGEVAQEQPKPSPAPVSPTPAPEEVAAGEPTAVPTPVSPTPAPEEIAGEESTPIPTPAPVPPTPAPMEITDEPTTVPTTAPVPATPAPEEISDEPTPGPTPAPVPPTPAPEEVTEEPTVTPEASTPAPVTRAPEEPAVGPVDDGGDDNKKVATPRFTGGSSHSITSYTADIECDTEGATIRYTIDGSDPKASTPSVREVSPGEAIFVHQIGTVTIRAVATKEGMEDSDEANKAVTIQDQVHDPELDFEGEEATADESGGNENAFLRTVAITMSCSTPNVTLHYTTDGVSNPGVLSPSVPAGTVVHWSDEGTAVFRVTAVADGLYHSEMTEWPVTIVAPRTDEYSVAGQPASSSSSEGEDMLARVEVTAIKAVYPAPAAILEQEEGLGPGFGGECEDRARVVSGKLIRLLNPSRHFSFAVPPGACGADGVGANEQVLSPASETARAFEVVRRTAQLLDGESPAEARVRLDLDVREAAWLAAGGGVGCQAAVAGGLLLPTERNGGGGGGAGCSVGHLIGSGQVFNAEEGTGLVSFGIRGDSFVVGDITADEVLDDQNPFQNLISGAGWLVRAGVNHVEASARDGHLDILLDAKDGVRGSDGATVDDEDDDDDGGDDDGATAVGGGGDAGRLDDVLVAKLARTAIGHDAEGRLILLQTSGASAGSDEDTAVPDGLDLYELADVLVEAGAVNAINLIGGAPSAMVVNGSAIVDPAEACWSAGDHGSNAYGSSGGGGGGAGFSNGSTLPRCERPVSSLVCVHLDPPPTIDGTDSGPTPTPAAEAQSSSTATAASGSASTNGDVDDWNSGWDSSGGGSSDEEDIRLQWEQELCRGNGTGNGTSLWEHLDGVEESLLRYKIAFWVAAVLGSLSVYFNIQHQKSSSASTSRSAELGGGVYGRQRQQQQHVGLINDGMAKTGTSSVGVVEMTSKGSKRGSRGSSSRRKRGSSNGGGYARVNGDADWDDDEMDGGGGGGGAHGLMDSEEEVDLGLVPSRSTSSRKREKGKSGRLRKALSKVSKGRGDGGGSGAAGAPGHGGGDLDAAMAINPFGGGGRRGSRAGPGGEAYDVV